MNTKQPEALRREYRATMPPEVLHLWALDVLACIASLEAQLEAVGAGGVGPLIASAGFDAADMATAAAQGFRDGVASVSAGSEPVASYAIRILVAADLITQAKADEALRLAAEITPAPAPADGESK